PRALAGSAVAVAVGGGLALLGSPWFAAAGLAAGWAVAVPADRAGRVALRALPLLVASLIAPSWDDLTLWWRVLTLAVSPAGAALAVWALDSLWVGGARLVGSRRIRAG
ncbi:MAG: hypothetical protein ACRDVM_06925, partial [Acidimicrobiia bacterium]